MPKCDQWPSRGSLGAARSLARPAPRRDASAAAASPMLRSARLAVAGGGGRAYAPTPPFAQRRIPPAPFGVAPDVSRLRRDLFFPLAQLSGFSVNRLHVGQWKHVQDRA